MRTQLRVGGRFSWVVAWAMAAGGPLGYLLWPGDLTWWVAPLLVVPLVLMAESRRERKGHEADYAGGGGDGGGWGPPVDHGGGP